MRDLVLSLMLCASRQGALAERPNRIFAAMPPYPTKPDDYLYKWGMFCLKAPPGEDSDFLSVRNRYNQPYRFDDALDLASAEPLSSVNGWQINRDGSRNWFVLIGDGARLFLATGKGRRLVGGDLTVTELVGDQTRRALLASPNAQPDHSADMLGVSMDRKAEFGPAIAVKYWSDLTIRGCCTSRIDA